MLTEKDMYKFLKDIVENKELNITTLPEFRAGLNISPEIAKQLENKRLLIEELKNRNYINSDAFNSGSLGNPYNVKISICNRPPRITVDGSNFMEYYRKKGSLSAKFINFTLYIFAFLGALFTVLQILEFLGILAPKCK